MLSIIALETSPGFLWELFKDNPMISTEIHLAKKTLESFQDFHGIIPVHSSLKIPAAPRKFIHKFSTMCSPQIFSWFFPGFSRNISRISARNPPTLWIFLQVSHRVTKTFLQEFPGNTPMKILPEAIHVFFQDCLLPIFNEIPIEISRKFNQHFHWNPINCFLGIPTKYSRSFP